MVLLKGIFFALLSCPSTLNSQPVIDAKNTPKHDAMLWFSPDMMLRTEAEQFHLGFSLCPLGAFL